MQGGGPLYMVGTHSEETKALMARDPPPLQLSKGGGGIIQEVSSGIVLNFPSIKVTAEYLESQVGKKV